MRKYVFIFYFLVEKKVNAENKNKIFIAILKMFYVVKPMVLIQNIVYNIDKYVVRPHFFCFFNKSLLRTAFLFLLCTSGFSLQDSHLG